MGGRTGLDGGLDGGPALLRGLGGRGLRLRRLWCGCLGQTHRLVPGVGRRGSRAKVEWKTGDVEDESDLAVALYLFGSSPPTPLRLPVFFLTWVQHRNTHSTALPLGRHPSNSLLDESPQDSPSPCLSSSSSRPSPSEPLLKPR
jgi:hypothetical protein